MKPSVFFVISLIAVFCIIGGQADVPRTRDYGNDRNRGSGGRVIGGSGGRRDQYDRNSDNDRRHGGGGGGGGGSGAGGSHGGGGAGGSHGGDGKDDGRFGRPQTLCSCSRIFKPVCGSDGHTYSNVCLLNCKNKESHASKHIRVACNRSCPCSSYGG